jgi:methylated-DNA-[protein]-cysteine S-methyltransferase/AraC family transcriptional regulator of adaptative response/methylated-DNA-[protein]-cysteine methyltransferase
MRNKNNGVTNMILMNMDAAFRVDTTQGAASEEIAFAVGESALGTVLVARSAQGVCAILIGSESAELESDLTARFRESRLVRDDWKLGEDLRKILRFIDTPAEGLDLALDIRGTPFQQRVWEVLLRIPIGATVTYSALARRIGEPDAVRAVANACAANAIALAIPCHRVVRSDGTLSGYRWGIERKRALLAKEALADSGAVRAVETRRVRPFGELPRGWNNMKP